MPDAAALCPPLDLPGMSIRKWSKGERVVHATRPEWGSGEVVGAEPHSHDGKTCQRLTVRFERAGTKTISTAFADLREATSSPFAPMPSESHESTNGNGSMQDAANGTMHPSSDAMSGGMTPKELAECMTKLPESVSDPFISLAKRCRAGLELYRLGESPAGLLDWAAIQTGLKDPLSRFNRHELEQWFDRFKMALDAHLKKLLKDARKQEPTLLAELQASASPSARHALRRIDADR